MKPKVLKPFDKIELTGSEELVDKWFKIEIVDMENIFGVSIDREINNRIVYHSMEPNETKRPKFPKGRTYIPAELQWNDKLTMIMRLVVKVTTPVKLNLILEDEGGTSLIAPEDLMATEVHFVQLEGIHKHYEANFSILKHMWWSMFRSKH